MGSEAKHLSQTIVPNGNSLRFPQASLFDRLMDAEIVVRIFDKPIPRRVISGGRLVLAFCLRALRRLWLDKLRGVWLRLIILGGKIDRRDFRQGLLWRLRREGFRDANGLRCLERCSPGFASVACPIQSQ